MDNPLQNKINDFVQWCETALQHFGNQYYEDALTNMRKSGEAACKLMIIQRFNERTAKDKTAGKSYKELIRIIINYGIAPRSVINWLEALQIHGNMATHDNKVVKEQAEYSMTALRLLTQWLFEEHLAIATPSKLDKALKQTTQPVKTEDDTRQLEAELTRLQKEKEGLQSKLQSAEGKTQEEADKTTQLEKQLEQAETQIKEMELLRQKAALLEKELALAKREKEEQAAVPAKKPMNKKALIGIAAAVVLLLGGWFIVDRFIIGDTIAEDANEEPILAGNTRQRDTLKVLILPLTLLQDNPNITLKVEDALEGRIRQRIIERKLPLSVHFNSAFSKTSLTVEDAVQAGKDQNAGLVFYGQLYEPTNVNDSVRIDLKYALTREEGQNNGYITIKAFKTLTDSAFFHIQTQVETVLDFALADRYMDRHKYSDALAQLYNTKGYGKDGKASVYNLKALCYYHLKDYPSAIREIENYIELDPEGSYGYAFMANLLKTSGEFEKAREYYETALRMEPNNVITLLNYGDLLAGKNHEETYNIYKSKEIILKALEYDSTVATGWQYLGDIENDAENYVPARKHYSKCLSLDSTNTHAKKSLAQILAFQFNEPEKAEKLVSEVLQQDSTDADALFILGNIYTSTSLKKPKLAEYLINKSAAKYPRAQYAHHYGKALAAHQQGKLDSALVHYLAAFAIDSSDLSLSNAIAQLYLDLPDLQKGIKQLEYSYTLDSMSHMVNYNLGYVYYFGAQKGVDMNKAKFYLERALKTNPYDTYNLEYLGAIHFHLGNIKRAEDLFLELLKLSPDNFYGNKYMGMLTENKGKSGQAINYYEKAMKIDPNDGELYAKLALMLMKESTANVNQALPLAKKANKLIPNNPEVMYILAQVFYYASDFPQSSHYYYRAVGIMPSLKDPAMEKELAKSGY